MPAPSSPTTTTNDDAPALRIVRDDDPTTSARTERVGDVDVVTLEGALDARLGHLLTELVASGPERPIVIDLSESVIVDPGALEVLDPVIWGLVAEQLCVSCRRLSGRRLLARAGVPHRMAVFQRPADAVQAKVLQAAGYGEGWSDLGR